jgi:hypothetical protein
MPMQGGAGAGGGMNPDEYVCPYCPGLGSTWNRKVAEDHMAAEHWSKLTTKDLWWGSYE